MTDSLRAQDVSWQDKAGCKGHPAEFFFPDTKADKRAYKICMYCEVAKQCFNYALANNEEYGVWGGVNFQVNTKPASKRISNIMVKHAKFMVEYEKRNKVK